MPKIAYIDRRFNESSYAIIEHANNLIADYAAQGLALTLRQLYYRFVAADLLANTQKNYDRLGSIVSNARLAGLMDWDAIEDRGRQLESLPHWRTTGEIIESAAYSFRFDKWLDQHYRVEVWVEKQALESVVGQAAEPYDCAYFACKGYTSQSEMWRAAQRLEQYVDAGQEPVIIHLGDHDPSGIDMTRDIRERLNDLFGVEVEVERIALNMDQIRQYKPPPNPAKMTDSRFKQYMREHGRSSWELDALEPATLRDLIQETIEQFLDREKFDACLAREAEARKTLEDASAQWGEVAKFVQKKASKKGSKKR
jgi:hypothetical protein